MTDRGAEVSAPAAPERAGDRGRGPRRVAVVIAVVGLALTGATAWAAARIDHNTQQRLLEGQTKQAATVLSTAIRTIQQPLDAALDVQRATVGRGATTDDAPFKELMSSYVGPDKVFQNASLWHRQGTRLDRVAAIGSTPVMSPDDPETLAHLSRAFDTDKTTVRLVTVGDRAFIAYTRADATTGWLVYGERAIPSDRRAPVDTDSAYSQLRYAIYLGRDEDADALSTTNVDPATLPLHGITARQAVAFGDNVLTLVTTPRSHLGGDLSRTLPWILLVGGLLLTLVATRVGQQLSRDRQAAQDDAATIQALYEQTDTLFAQQRELFVRLQRALLPQVNPVMPHVELASEYVAGARGLDIGGDWFSIIEADHGRFGFVVGDVSGRGVDAVAVMAHARFTIRAYLLDGDDPATVLEKCSRQFDITTDGHMTTALVGVGDWRTGEMTLASAGHPPPVLLNGAGPQFAHVRPGRPLGTGTGPYPTTTIALSPGATLFCYTDGLVERRGEDIDTGLARLSTLLASVADRPVDEIVDHAVHTLRNDDAPDDIAAVAIRWTGAG